LQDDVVEIVFVKLFKKISVRTNYMQVADNKNIVPIFRYKEMFSYRSSFESNGDKMVTRKQFPLALNYANTVHSVQSLTNEGEMLYDIKSCDFNARLLYTALTRSKKLENLFILRSFTKKDITKHPTKDMITQDKELLEKYKQTIIKYSNLVPDNLNMTILGDWKYMKNYLVNRYIFQVASYRNGDKEVI
jgi:hypothetical protein